MKKTCTVSMAVLFSLFLCSSAIAQESPLAKGTSSLSVGLGFSPSSLFAPAITSDVTHVLRISPSYEYFILPGLSVGGWLAYENRTSKRASIGYTAIGPRAVYYLPYPGRAAGSRLLPYLSAAASYTWRRSISPENNGLYLDQRRRYVTGSLGLGLKYMFHKNIGLYFEMGYEAGRLLNGSQRFNPFNGPRSSGGVTFTF